MEPPNKLSNQTKKNLERELWQWYCLSRTPSGGKVSKSKLQARAKWTFNEAGMVGFKASDGWYRRFTNRWRLVVIETASDGNELSLQTVNSSDVQDIYESNVDAGSTMIDKSNIQLNSKTLETSNGSCCNQKTLPGNLGSQFISFNPIKLDRNLSNRMLPPTTDCVENFAQDKTESKSTVNNIDLPMAIVSSGTANESIINNDVTTVNNFSNSTINDREIIDCLSNFINTSELSQTSMDFFYDSDDSSFSTTENAFLLAETENQSNYDSLLKPNEFKSICNKVKQKHHRKRGERYLPRFKEKVLAYVANQHTIKNASEKFKIDSVTISRWKQEMTLKKMEKSAGETDEVIAADEQFLTWLRRCRDRKVNFTADELKIKAKQLIDQGSRNTNRKWFMMWSNRINETSEEEIKGERHIHYPDAFKLEVAAFAELRSQISVAKLFNVSRRRVFDWLKIYRKRKTTEAVIEEDKKTVKQQLRFVPDAEIDGLIWNWYQKQEPKPNNKQVRAKGVELYRGKGDTELKCSYGWFRRWCARYSIQLRHDTDKQLLQWTLTQLEANKTISHNNLQIHALRLLSTQRPGFKASNGWALRFCRRHPQLLQTTPTLNTPLPVQLLPKIARYRNQVRSTISEKSLPFSAIGNVDELHLNFVASAPGIHNKKTLLLRKSTMENCHATIVLACLADGNMLPPAIILKGNPEDCIPEGISSNLMVMYQANAHLDESLMTQWLDKVWFAHVQTPNLLIADCFPPHSSESVKQAFVEKQSCIKIIPGGCTSKLQPLDVSIKNIFHTLMEKQWGKYNAHCMQMDPRPWVNSIKFKIPECLPKVIQWVHCAYEIIQTTKQETIRRCFLVTGLTVSANHSEDHFIENQSMIPNDDSNV